MRIFVLAIAKKRSVPVTILIASTHSLMPKYVITEHNIPYFLPNPAPPFLRFGWVVFASKFAVNPPLSWSFSSRTRFC
jgi:hypothetical protein